jgi:hypothetical protein
MLSICSADLPLTMEQAREKPRPAVLFVARLLLLVVSLAGAEGMLRLLGYPPWWAMDPNWGGPAAEYQCDPDLGWRPRQGQFHLHWSDQTGETLYTNWSQGRRATMEQQEAWDSSGRPQVLLFGDSFVQGYELSDSDTLPWIVQHRHPELKVSNFGSGNYGTYQSYLAIRKWVREPAAVYYFLNGFHEERNAGDRSWLRVNRKPATGCFYPYAELSGGELRQERSDGYLVWPLSRRLRSVAMLQEYVEIFDSYLRVRNKRALTETLLQKMDEAVRAQGGKFTVILFDMDAVQRAEYRRFVQSRGINFVDCDRPEMKDRKLRLPDNHPNQGLNQLLAHWIEPLQVVSGKNTERAGKF